MTETWYNWHYMVLLVARLILEAAWWAMCSVTAQMEISEATHQAG